MTMTKMLLGAAAALIATAAVAQSEGEPMYVVTYYSDASYSQVVGGERPIGCGRNGVTYSRYGQVTAFREESIAGYCSGGRTSPD